LPSWAALIGVVNQPAIGATARERHLERVNDEF
jgi:hypothetical protein